MTTGSDKPSLGSPSKPVAESAGAKSISAGTVSKRRRPLRLRIHSAVHWLHVYISMFSLLAILFFALTGITLNHPDWVFGSAETKTEVSGTLPAGWTQGSEIDWLKVSEYLRKEHSVHGTVEDPQSDEIEGSLSFQAPGYAADCFIQRKTGEYKMTIAGKGLVAVLNDFHRGADAGKVWSWVIDLSGALLSLVALTGLGLLIYLRKIRITSLVTMAAGAIVVIIIMKLAT